ncbi:glycoside hydrolase [Violaceomyces palustris]|uniref:Glycoside hydrolase n=1 Tax=Violaceomyces palustris TaxID=1673888 RepID=A0ACD0NS82_9BASI|nr:glycoside hydrolase [Violaceomyces palustris]
MSVPKANVAYFVNWGIYARGYKPQQVPVESLTHILYAFADCSPETGEVKLTDSWSDEQIHYEGDSWNDQGNNLYGNFKQFSLLKRKHRHLKLIISIGGWTFSSHFAPMACDGSKRQRFVETSLKLLEDNGLDGLDIDWEYPENDSQAQDYVTLLRELREGLNAHANKKGCPPYLLTIAAPCGPSKYEQLRIEEMDPFLDFWNLMAYDFSGSWESVAGHQANLFGPAPSGDASVNYYTSKGVAPYKLVLGIPLYGRCFQNTEGPGKPYQGIGQGSWEAGVYDFKALPLQGASEQEQPESGISWSYNDSTREMISYDTVQVALAKARYIKARNLKGAMYWELSGDCSEDGRSIVKNLGNLDLSENHLDYPFSKWDNIRNRQP